MMETLDFFIAIREGDLTSIKRFISNGIHPDLTDPQTGYRPILLAATLGHMHVVDYLQKLNVTLSVAIIANPTDYEGYGDIIFGQKIFECVLNVLESISYRGDIILITQDFEYDKPFKIHLKNTNLITMHEITYLKLLAMREFRVDYYIHGPVQDYFLPSPIYTRILILNEYSSSLELLDEIKNQRNLARHRIRLMGTGFSYHWKNESPLNKYKRGAGIFVNYFLHDIAELKEKDGIRYEKKRKSIATRIPKEITNLIFNVDQIDKYFSKTELSFTCFHSGEEKGVYHQNIHQHYFRIHEMYSKHSKKNQDIVSVGANYYNKILALESCLSLKKHYNKISFIDVSQQKSTIIFDAGKHGRQLRLFHYNNMPHNSILQFIAISGDLTGVTGDQSFGEALSAHKLIVYECMSWKEILALDYIDLVYSITLEFKVKELARLLLQGSTDDDYKHLEALITDKKTVHQLRMTASHLINEFDLSKSIHNQIKRDLDQAEIGVLQDKIFLIFSWVRSKLSIAIEKYNQALKKATMNRRI